MHIESKGERDGEEGRERHRESERRRETHIGRQKDRMNK